MNITETIDQQRSLAQRLNAEIEMTLWLGEDEARKLAAHLHQEANDPEWEPFSPSGGLAFDYGENDRDGREIFTLRVYYRREYDFQKEFLNPLFESFKQ